MKNGLYNWILLYWIHNDVQIRSSYHYVTIGQQLQLIHYGIDVLSTHIILIMRPAPNGTVDQWVFIFIFVNSMACLWFSPMCVSKGPIDNYHALV